MTEKGRFSQAALGTKPVGTVYEVVDSIVWQTGRKRRQDKAARILVRVRGLRG